MKKPRADSVLDALPEERKQKLIEWLLRNLGYFKISAMLKAEFGVRASISMIGRFHDRWVKPILKENIRNSAKVADLIEEEMAKRPDVYDAALIKNVKRRAFDLSCDPASDPKDLKALLDPLIKRQVLEFDREKFRASQQSKIDAGFDELLREAENDPETQELIRRARDRIAAKLQEAA